jgi:NTP pyrophosphatase (non-canonical NTP hydrolase)
MNLSGYLRAAKRTKPTYLSAREELTMLSMGLSGEAGEFLDEVKKILYHGHQIDSGKLCKELGDIHWYWSLLCDCLGLDQSVVLSRNISKLTERYKKGFSPAESISRKEYHEPQGKNLNSAVKV